MPKSPDFKVKAHIRIERTVWTDLDQRRNPQGFQNALSRWHHEHHNRTAPFINCLLCDHPAALLTVRRLPTLLTAQGQIPERFILAALPGKSTAHTSDCEFADPKTHGKAAENRPGITESVTGVTIRLSRSLSPSGPRSDSSEPRPPDGTATTSTAKKPATLLSLLHFLFEKSCLVSWHGDRGEIKWNRALWIIAKTMTALNLKIGRAVAIDRFLRIPTFHPEIQAEVLDLCRTWSEHKGQQVLALCLMKDLSEFAKIAAGEGQKTQWGYFKIMDDDSLRIAMDAKIATEAFKAQTITPHPDIAYAVLIQGPVTARRRNDHSEFFTIDPQAIAVLCIHRRTMIPLQSPADLPVLDALLAENRVFDKPLFYPDGSYAPNFILRDTGPYGTPLEIHCHDDKNNAERKTASEDHFLDEPPPYDNAPWEWNTDTDADMQPFPPIYTGTELPALRETTS
jgi:hypothetical protein